MTLHSVPQSKTQTCTTHAQELTASVIFHALEHLCSEARENGLDDIAQCLDQALKTAISGHVEKMRKALERKMGLD